MQNSSTFPQLSDGVRKTVVKTPGTAPMRPMKMKPLVLPKAKPTAPVHRRGGFAQHQKRGR
jgi:hypothetical protein